MLLRKMVEFGASGLFIMGNQPVWMSVNGRKVKVTERSLSNEECEAMLNTSYKSNSASTIVNSKKPLDYAYQYRDQAGSAHRFRVNAVSATRNNSSSMTITFRLIQSIPPTIEQLGIPADIVKACQENDKGIIYVAGATGQGKSTTLAAIMRHILSQEDANVNMVDVGAPIEYALDSIDWPNSFVTPIEVGRDLQTFYEAVVNCMRMEPQIIQISESRDMETISASLDASKSGHAVFTTVHSGSVAETLRRVVNMFPFDGRSMIQLDVVESTKMIIAQKLLNTVDGKRTAIREYLDFDAAVREKLWATNNIAKTAAEVVAESGYPMSRDVERVYSEGLIDVKEYDKQMKEYEMAMSVVKRG
jgi:defect-in-organelle-trafficking protein DotB